MHRKKGVKEKGQSKKRKIKKHAKAQNTFTCPKFKLLLDFV